MQIMNSTGTALFIVGLLYFLLHGLLYASQPAANWSKRELAIIKSLWLGSLEIDDDSSNRFINNPEAIALGHKLFFDKRLSANGEVSCASCHQPEKYFSDGLKTAEGTAVGPRNTPTVVGISQQSWFFHDGRADSLWSQALGPFENAREHNSNRGHIAHTIYSDPQLRNHYERLFGSLPELTNQQRFPTQAGPVEDTVARANWQSMTADDKQLITRVYVNAGKAIAAYEAQLQPAASRFDHYVSGLINNESAAINNSLTQSELNGLRIFVTEARCITCHSGPLFSDGGFHNISVQPDDGKPHDWGRYRGARQLLENPFNCRSEFNDQHRPNKQASCDELRYMVMDRHETQGAIKTPSLRNVSKTAPYMHGGQYATLRDVIKHYNDPPPAIFRRSELFLQVDLTEMQMQDLEAFLSSLDSDIRVDRRYLHNPWQ